MSHIRLQVRDPVVRLLIPAQPAIVAFLFYNGSEEEGRKAYKAFFDLSTDPRVRRPDYQLTAIHAQTPSRICARRSPTKPSTRSRTRS